MLPCHHRHNRHKLHRILPNQRPVKIRWISSVGVLNFQSFSLTTTDTAIPNRTRIASEIMASLIFQTSSSLQSLKNKDRLDIYIVRPLVPNLANHQFWTTSINLCFDTTPKQNNLFALGICSVVSLRLPASCLQSAYLVILSMPTDVSVILDLSMLVSTCLNLSNLL